MPVRVLTPVLAGRGVAIRVVGRVELIRELAVDILRAQPVAADTCPEAEGMQAVVVAAVTAKDEFAISSKRKERRKPNQSCRALQVQAPG